MPDITKQCPACGETKELNEFPVTRVHGKERRRSECRPCHAARSRKYRARNLGACRARELAYSRTHAAQKRENATEWYVAHRERALASRKSYYAENAEKILDYQHRYFERRYYSDEREDRLWTIHRALRSRRSAALKRIEQRKAEVLA